MTVCNFGAKARRYVCHFGAKVKERGCFLVGFH